MADKENNIDQIEQCADVAKDDLLFCAGCRRGIKILLSCVDTLLNLLGGEAMGGVRMQTFDRAFFRPRHAGFCLFL